MGHTMALKSESSDMRRPKQTEETRQDERVSIEVEVRCGTDECSKAGWGDDKVSFAMHSLGTGARLTVMIS